MHWSRFTPHPPPDRFVLWSTGMGPPETVEPTRAGMWVPEWQVQRGTGVSQ